MSFLLLMAPMTSAELTACQFKRASSRHQLVQAVPSLLQIEGIEAFAEPDLDRIGQIAANGSYGCGPS